MIMINKDYEKGNLFLFNKTYFMFNNHYKISILYCKAFRLFYNILYTYKLICIYLKTPPNLFF